MILTICIFLTYVLPAGILIFMSEKVFQMMYKFFSKPPQYVHEKHRKLFATMMTLILIFCPVLNLYMVITSLKITIGGKY